VMGCPLEEAYIHEPIDYENYSAPHAADLYPCFAPTCCCCGSIDSIYTKMPQCLGISTNSECMCCCYTSNVCLKFVCGDEAHPKKNLMMQCIRQRHMIIQPSRCCSDQSQCFCCDHRCACPYDAVLPCTWIYIPFFTFMVNYRCICQCCLTLEQIQQIGQNANDINAGNKM